jgi:hypothetical protein
VQVWLILDFFFFFFGENFSKILVSQNWGKIKKLKKSFHRNSFLFCFHFP